MWAKYRVTQRKIIANADFPSQSVYGPKEKEFEGDRKNGRSDRIRTCDIQFPKLALYQAELRSDRPKSLIKSCFNSNHRVHG